ncbi:MAG: tripartite tricarboxylate transporter permease [Bacillota bacterium]
MEVLLTAIKHVFSPVSLLLIFGGVFFGLLLGAIPGLTATMAVGLIIPITFGLRPELAFPLLVALYVGGISGGLVSASLIGIPGTPSSVTTTFDSYAMTKKGKPGRALGLGAAASLWGGLASAVALVTIAPPLAKFALKFGPFEFTSLFLLTFACVTAVTGESRIKGYLALLIGLFLSMVGMDPINGVERFTLGFYQLSAGFSQLPALIGLFTLSEVVSGARQGKKPTIIAAQGFSVVRDFLETLFVIPKHFFLFIRTTILGVAIGIFPGIGPGLANVLCYAQAKAGAKEPELFGKGSEEGIIGAESGNNAATGGALIPLLTLGVPGDTVTALILGAFMLHGIQPGPLLFRANSQFVTIIFVAFFVANIVTWLLQLACSRVFIKALSTPVYILAPVILLFCAVGSFALNNRIFDIWVFMLFGLIGLAFSVFKVPLLPLLMGLILGKSFEKEFRTALILSKGSLMPFFTRPISLALIIMAVLLVIYLSKLSARAHKTLAGTGK